MFGTYDFRSVASSLTGTRCDNVSSLNDKRERLSRETRILSSRLESQGVPAFDKCEPVFAIGEVTGEIEKTDGRYRHIQILPEVAVVDRSRTIKELSYFIENHPCQRFFRYAVITSGNRVEYGGNLRERRRIFHSNFRRWSSEAERDFGVKLLYRGSEYTFNSRGVHFHTNVVYWPTRRLSDQEWSGFLSWSKRRLGGVIWKDCGRLRDVREVVKYICKLSSDSSGNGSYGVDELSSQELAWFHEQTYRTKASQALGDFAEFRKELEEKRQKIAVFRRFDGSRKLVLMDKEPAKKRSQNRTAGGGKPENVVLCRTLPRPGRSGVVQPWTMVCGYTPTPSTGCGRDGLALIDSNKKQAMKWAEGNGYKIYNNTPTVQTDLQAGKRRVSTSPPVVRPVVPMRPRSYRTVVVGGMERLISAPPIQQPRKTPPAIRPAVPMRQTYTRAVMVKGVERLISAPPPARRQSLIPQSLIRSAPRR